ncbi:MAG: hypothetical protein Q9213_007751 [Squamulea squamosa]
MDIGYATTDGTSKSSIPSIRFGLLFLVLLSLLYGYLLRRREYQAETVFGEQHGCQPMKSKFPIKWPLGLDVLYKQWHANANKRLLAFQQPFLDKLGPNLEIKIMGSVGYTTYDPSNVEAVLSTRFDDYYLGTRRGAMFPFIGEGIFTQDGAAWKHSRELLRRPFLKTYYQDLKGFLEPIDHCLAKIASCSGVLDLQPLFFQFTLATTTALIFGQPIESSEDQEQDSFASSFDHASWITTLRSRLTDLYWIYNPNHYQDACRMIKEFADGFVRRALSAKEGDKSSERYAFIKDLHAELNDTSLVRDQLVNILLAGRDTTACLLSWTFFLLVRHPKVLSRLQGEIRSTVGTSDEITKTHIQKMDYLKCILNETLRLYPPIPLNVRFANKVTWLPRGGGPDEKSPVLVRKGLGIGIVPYYMHRRKDIYGEDAMDFRPERWEGPELADIGYAYMPFHGGPRLCLGKDFALMEASCLIIRILQEFPFIRLPEGHPVVPTGQEMQELTIFLKSAEGFLGAAATAGKALDHISSSRHAPEHLVALVNEVSDLRVVLHNVRDAVQERATTSQKCGNLGFIVQRATLKLSELNRLIYGNLLKTNTGNNSFNDDDTIKASRRAFLRHSGKIKSLKEEIQDIKMSMMIAMGAMTLYVRN